MEALSQILKVLNVSGRRVLPLRVVAPYAVASSQVEVGMNPIKW